MNFKNVMEIHQLHAPVIGLSAGLLTKYVARSSTQQSVVVGCITAFASYKYMDAYGHNLPPFATQFM
jgi:hypothetical protein